MVFANSDSVRQLKIEEITKAKTQKFGKINGKFRAIDFRDEKEKEELWFSIDRNWQEGVHVYIEGPTREGTLGQMESVSNFYIS